MDNTLIYISGFGGESQVLNLLKELEYNGYISKIYLLVCQKNEVKWKLLCKRTQNTNIKVFRFRHYPNYSFFNIFQFRELNSLLKKIISDNTIIHLRGEVFTSHVKKVVVKNNHNNVKIITDVRGASYEEILLYSKIKQPLLQFKLFQLKKNLKSLNKNSDYISCVSTKLKDYVIEKSKFDKEKIYINHCIAGDDFKYSIITREKYRKILNLEEKDVLFLFITSGSGSWQNTEEIINLIISKGYKILNLSPNVVKHENVINLFVPYSEVSNYLNAADIGIVWRNDDVVNNVAAPIKFSEYVCSGLPVIANNGVDLINVYIEETGFGVTTNSINLLDINVIDKLLSMDRKEISHYGHQIFSLDVISKQYRSLYKDVIES